MITPQGKPLTNTNMKENCTNQDLLDLIQDCPNLIEKLYKEARLDFIEAYDMVLGDYDMSFGTLPPLKKGESWGYYYCIDGEKHTVDNGVMLKTKAQAQLAAVYDTRYTIENRIKEKLKQQLI